MQDPMKKDDIPESDDELYSCFLLGNISAYDQLLIRYGDNLTFFINGYLHNLQDAEDLMIEAFARIMVKKPSIREGNFKAYLFRTARNLAARFHSVFSRAKVFSLEDLAVEPADKATLKEKLLDTERKQAMHRCLDRIDPDLREVLWLIYIEDLSYTEAASVMGVNNKKIDHLLQRGKKLMAKELEKEGITNAHE